MGVHPVIRECECPPQVRYWWSGWLVGVLCGVFVSAVTGFISCWTGL